MEQSSKKDVVVTLAVLLVTVFIVTGVIITKKQPSTLTATVAPFVATAATADTTSPVVKPNPTPAQSAKASVYKDGGYTASGKYSTPEGTESITISITLKNDVISETSATANPRSRDSKQYIAMFIENYKSQVIGKNIAELKLGRVSGSSLTPQGFNAALQTIAAQAKA